MTRWLHIALGLLGVVAFVLTGAYMRFTFPAMDTMEGGTRMLLRSRHIYILLASLLNLGLGTYYRSVGQGWRSRLQMLGSCLILVGPPLFLAAFCTEATRSVMQSRLVPSAVIALLTGTLCHLVVSIRRSGH